MRVDFALRPLCVSVMALALLAPIASAAPSGIAGQAIRWMAAQQADTADTMRQQQNQSSREQQKQQQRQKEQQEKQGTQSAKMQNSVLAADLVGMDVYNHKNEQIGKLDDIVFDHQHQRVAYAVLSTGGFLGIGANDYAVPWDQVQAQLSEGRVIVPIDKATLEGSPTIEDEENKMQKASELIGSKIRLSGPTQPTQPRDDDGFLGDLTGDDESAGEIDDLLLSNDGRLEMAIIQPDEEVFPDVREYNLLAVPWSRMQVTAEEEMVVANFEQSQAQDLAVSQYELDSLDDQQFRGQIYSALGEQSPQIAATNGSGQNGQQGQAMQRWSSFAEQCLGQDLSNADSTISGTIMSLMPASQSRPNEMNGQNGQSRQSGSADDLKFTLTTGDNQQVTAYAGPKSAAPGLQLSEGDRVTLRGTACEQDGQQVFVPASIEHNGQTYELSQQNGAPKWEPKNGGSQRKSDQPPRARPQGGR